MFKGKKNSSIRLKLKRMRKKSVTKKIQNGGSSSISTSDQQQPAKSHHISYLSTDEIRNLQVNFYILLQVDSLPNILISNLIGITFLCEVTTFIKVCVAFVFVLQTL